MAKTDSYHVPAFKIVRRLADGLLLAILLTAMFLTLAPTTIYAQGPEITITPDSGVIGSWVTIKGTGFPSASTIDISIDDVYLVEGIQTDNGTFMVLVEIPDLPPGKKTVTATVWSVEYTYPATTSTFTVLSPQISVIPTSGASCSKVTIMGIGFPKSEISIEAPLIVSVTIIDITMDDIPIKEGVFIDADGTFSVDAYVPPLDPGVKMINAVSDTGQVSVTTPFTVLPPQTTIPPPPTPTGPPPSPGPEPGGGVPPWIWSIPPTIIIAGAGGYSLKRWMDTRRIKVRLYKDNGTQQIESGTPIHPDSEIGLRPVLDPGKQSIEAEDSSVVNEWRKKP